MRSPPASLLLAVFVLLLAGLHGAQAARFCRAIAMSGGGDKAAYEAGVLHGLIDNLPSEETEWNVVTGISAGSTLTAALSAFPLGAEHAAAEFVDAILADLNQTSIFRMWPGGFEEALTKRSSLFDSTPLRELFQSALGGRTLAKDRIACMGASNLRTGQFERFCEHESMDAVVNATLASVAIPGVFLAQQLRSAVTGRLETYVDGGVLTNVDVSGAVQQCLDQGFTQEQTIVDVVQCGGTNLTVLDEDTASMTALPILLRAGQMRSFSSDESDYAAAVRAFPRVHWRFRIFPSEPIPGSGIDFDKETMAWMQQLGRRDAKNAVQALKAKEAKGAKHAAIRLREN